MTDEQVAEFSAQVARESWTSLNAAYRGCFDTRMDLAAAKDGENADDIMEDCEIYLYVYSNGNWTIEGAQYLTDHRNIVAAISLHQVNGPAELAEEIEQDYDDEGCEIEA